ncbi:hypothetical protein SLEP1_g34602 [Rubroshorea leprosula]|nr:hypothetical protein SLEP1_g34602 [Rubroshorea leprosula]
MIFAQYHIFNTLRMKNIVKCFSELSEFLDCCDFVKLNGDPNKCFFYVLVFRLAIAHNNIASNFNCRVLAVKQPESPLRKTKSPATLPALDSSTNMDFSQIEIAALQ